VISFHYFVDLCTDAGIKYRGEPSKLTAYEQAITAFIFINFILSICATVCVMLLGSPVPAVPIILDSSLSCCFTPTALIHGCMIREVRSSLIP
jgi:hypothetical protein